MKPPLKPLFGFVILGIVLALSTGCGPKGGQSLGASSADGQNNDAYAYYGLGSSTPKKYDLTMNRPTPSTTEQTITITKNTDKSGKTTYTETDEGVSGPGGQKNTNSQVMSLDPDGLYIESISPQTLKSPHFLQLPAKLDPGTTWKNHQSVEANGQTVDEDLDFKVTGVESVTTPAGTVQALHIVGDGTGKITGKPATLKVEMWYEKDFGMVKQSATITSAGVDTTIVQTLKK